MLDSENALVETEGPPRPRWGKSILPYGRISAKIAGKSESHPTRISAHQMNSSSSSSQTLMFLLLMFGTPLVAGIFLLFMAKRLRRAWAAALAAIAGTLCILAFLFYLIVGGPYLWALHLESKWQAAKPTTMAGLESNLSLYSKRDIAPAQSGWGQNHKLLPGERMTQYLLLWSAPLDVVYTSDNTIVAIYTSYE
jgi:hypothetical protein